MDRRLRLDRISEDLRLTAPKKRVPALRPARQPPGRGLHLRQGDQPGAELIRPCRAGASAGSTSRARNCTSQAAITTRPACWPSGMVRAAS
jgi:hypothetical protein